MLAPLGMAREVRPWQQQPPDPVETGAWFKVLGLSSGSPEPVVLSEAETNALLGSVQLSALFAERAGLLGLSARLLPDEVRLSGMLDGGLAARILGPLAPAGGQQPFETVLRLEGTDGSGEAKVLRGTVAGLEVPAPLLTGVIVSVIHEILQDSGSSESFDPDASFPLPRAIAGFEVRSGEILLTPAPPG